MSRSELGTLPAPPTEAEINRHRLFYLCQAAKIVNENYNDPRELARRLVIYGFRFDLDSWAQVQAVRDTIARIWFPPRNSGIA